MHGPSSFWNFLLFVLENYHFVSRSRFTVVLKINCYIFMHNKPLRIEAINRWDFPDSCSVTFAPMIPTNGPFFNSHNPPRWSKRYQLHIYIYIYIHLYKHKCQSVKVVRIRGWKKRKQYIKDKWFSKPKSQRMYVGLKKFP